MSFWVETIFIKIKENQGDGLTENYITNIA